MDFWQISTTFALGPRWSPGGPPAPVMSEIIYREPCGAQTGVLCAQEPRRYQWSRVRSWVVMQSLFENGDHNQLTQRLSLCQADQIQADILRL